jgi:subtilisin family serine protease
MRVITRRLQSTRAASLLIVLLVVLVAALRIGASAGSGQGAASVGLGQGGATSGPGQGKQGLRPHVEGELLIKFKGSSPAAERANVRANLGAQRRRGFRSGAEHWTLPPGLSTEKAMARQRGNPHIEYIEPNYILGSDRAPNDPRYAELYGLNNIGQTGGTPGADISAESAWDGTTGSRDVVVAVIDSGIDYAHEDLAGNIFINDNEIPGNGMDDDNNGYVDDVHGWDFINDDNDPFDDNGHGTHVAGTIGAVGDNGLGIAGVSWEVSILPLKFLNASGSGSTSDAVTAIEYAITMGADVVNASWGGSGYSLTLRGAIEEAATADILVVASAGNDGRDIDLSPHYPASYLTPNIVAVAATDHSDDLASFSNFGPNAVDLTAPGVATLSTVPAGYGFKNGTSMAAPHVAGAACLIRAAGPDIGVMELKQRLLDFADPVADLAGKVLTGGRLNAYLPIAVQDHIAPDMIVDLATEAPGGSSMGLVWSATGDDGLMGIASSYDVRYSTAPIDDLNFDAAARAAGEPTPLAAGTVQRMRVEGLEFNTTYFFAIRVRDEWGNASPASNMAIGTTLGPPQIRVHPAALQADLLTGQTVIRDLTIDNDGVSDLEFEMSAVLDRSLAGAAPPAAAEQIAGAVWMAGMERRSGARIIVEPPDEGGGGPGTGDWDEGYAPGRGRLAAGDITIGNLFSTGLRLLIVQSGADVSEIRDLLLAFPDISVVDQFDARIDTPDLPTLLEYDAVLLVINSTLADAYIMGYVLVDYADSGGGVVLTNASFTEAWQISGLFLSWKYFPLRATGGNIGSAALQNFAVGHPIMRGVNAATGDLLAAAVLEPGTEWIGDWSNGYPFAATKGPNVVTINVFVGQSGTWTGDIPLILHNAAFWSSGVVTWLSADPVSGIVPPGGSTSIAVTFDATGLIGGDYDAFILIDSNDPVTPQESVAAQLLVTSAPDIHLPEEEIDFGPRLVGTASDAVLTIENLGDLPLSISGLSVAGTSFSAASASFDLAPGESRELIVTFTPDTVGPLAGTLSLFSNDPDEGVITVALQGVGALPPSMTVSPASLTASLHTGQTSILPLNIANMGGSDLNWSILRPGPKEHPLEDYLTALNADFRSITDLIPSRYLFTEGVTGDRIINGGLDMYRNGNILSTNLGALVYSDDVIVDSAAFGPSGRFFTRKHPGLFVLGADLKGADRFTIRGAVGRLSYGIVDGTVLEVVRYGTIYRGFVKRIYNTSRPSVNHLVIVPDAPLARHSFPTLAGSDFHEVSNLPQDGRLYYLLYAGWFGYYIDDAATLAIMTSFIDLLGPAWLQVSPGAGSVTTGTSSDVDVVLDAAGLPGGLYEANIEISSDDPLMPLVQVPVDLQVTAAADIELSTTALEFGSVFVGATEELGLTVTNTGAKPLVVSEVSVDQADFTIDVADFVLEAGGRREVVVRFEPGTPSPLAGSMTLVSNDPNEIVTMVSLQGEGVPPPIIDVLPTTLAEILQKGEARSRTLTVFNNGSSNLSFRMRAMPEKPGGGNPAAGASATSAGTVPPQDAELTADGSAPATAPDGIQPVESETMFTAGATALLVQDYLPWGKIANEQILSANGIAFDRINTEDFPNTDLTRYRQVIVASDQPTAFYSRLAAQKHQVIDYVEKGGVLEYHAAAGGVNRGNSSQFTLPGGMRTVKGISITNRVLLPTHPLMANVTNPISGFEASFVHFTAVPSESILIAASNRSGFPTLLEYPYGRGWIVAGGLTFEVGYALGKETGIVLANMIPYTAGFVPTWLSIAPTRKHDPLHGGICTDLVVDRSRTGNRSARRDARGEARYRYRRSGARQPSRSAGRDEQRSPASGSRHSACHRGPVRFGWGRSGRPCRQLSRRAESGAGRRRRGWSR